MNVNSYSNVFSSAKDIINLHIYIYTYLCIYVYVYLQHFAVEPSNFQSWNGWLIGFRSTPGYIRYPKIDVSSPKYGNNVFDRVWLRYDPSPVNVSFSKKPSPILIIFTIKWLWETMIIWGVYFCFTKSGSSPRFYQRVPQIPMIESSISIWWWVKNNVLPYFWDVVDGNDRWCNRCFNYLQIMDFAIITIFFCWLIYITGCLKIAILEPRYKKCPPVVSWFVAPAV